MPAPSLPRAEKVPAGPRPLNGKIWAAGFLDTEDGFGTPTRARENVQPEPLRSRSWISGFPGLIGHCRPRRKTYRSTATARII
jgi:hypothetical protein